MKIKLLLHALVIIFALCSCVDIVQRNSDTAIPDRLEIAVNEIREAARSRDHHLISKRIKFPLLVKGSLDHDKNRFVKECDFPVFFDTFLDSSGGEIAPDASSYTTSARLKSQRECILESKQTRFGDFVRLADIELNQQSGFWIVTAVYYEFE
jgi:hypothetical protein